MRSEERWGSPDRVALMELEEKSTGDEQFDKKVVKPWDEMRPKTKEFLGLVPREKIEKDEEYLRNTGENFEKQSLAGRRGVYSVMEGIGSYNWFGEEAKVVPSHRYDDVRNGIDFVVCFPGEKGQSVKIGVDMTTSPSSNELREKILRTSENLKKGYASHVDYFNSGEEGEEKGRVYLPRVIIGTDAERADKLFRGFCDMIGKKRELGPQMARDNLQRELLKQIRRQLVYYLEDALGAFEKFHGREKNPVLSKIRVGLGQIEGMELGQEIESKELKDLLAVIENNREALFQIDPRLAGNIYKHTEALEAIEQVEKEKSSQGIESPGASNLTEEILELKKTSFA